MDLSQKLADLGFSNFEILNEESGLAKVKTTRGWDYQKFQTEAAVDKWAKFNKPEEE